MVMLAWTIVFTPWLQSVWDLRLVPGMIEDAAHSDEAGQVAA